MEYYKVVDNFSDFFAYLKSNMQPMDRHKVCIAYRDTDEEQDIYVATEDSEIKDIIESRYGLEKCDAPLNSFREEYSSWMFRGNQGLIEL